MGEARTTMLDVETLSDDVLRIRLNGGRGNPISPEMLAELEATLLEIRKAPPGALILAGGSGIFSGGFALPTIARWDRPAIDEFFRRFYRIMQELLTLPSPVVCAIDGHAIAGGFILTLACDFRIVSESRGTFGLPESDLGVAVPAGTLVLLEARMGRQAAARVAMTGRLFEPTEALREGFASELSSTPDARAVELATELAAKPGAATGRTRQLMNRTLAATTSRADDAGHGVLLDTWFSVHAQKELHALADKLSGKRR